MFVACTFYAHVSHAVSSQITSLMQITLNSMAAGDASQTAPVQITRTCFRVVLFYTNFSL